ncbi:MAG TPA: RDD family protein [Rhizomicrobium sp.]
MDETQTVASPMRPQETESAQFAGFWRRIFAALVDAIILGIAGWAVAIPFYNQLILWGPYGRALGFPVALLYFAILNSSIGGGGTLGKKALGIRVVSRDGKAIGLPRSLWRAVVYLVPMYLNGFDLSFLQLNPFQSTVASALQIFFVFGVLLATIYLYLANWRTRQVMHDLAAGTFVVRSAGVRVTQRINPIHLIVVGLLLAASLSAAPLILKFGPAKLQSQFGNMVGTNFPELNAIQAAVLKSPNVLSAAVNDQTSTFWTDGHAVTTTSIIVTVVWRGAPQSPELAADEIAKRVLQVSPEILDRQKLLVIVRYGFDIGITQSWNSNGYPFTPEEWRMRIQRALPNNSI